MLLLKNYLRFTGEVFAQLRFRSKSTLEKGRKSD